MKNLTNTVNIVQELHTLWFAYKFAHIHVNKLLDNICRLFEKTDLTTIIKKGMLNSLTKGKSSFDSNLIFIKSFLYLIDSPPFIVSI